MKDMFEYIPCQKDILSIQLMLRISFPPITGYQFPVNNFSVRYLYEPSWKFSEAHFQILTVR